MAVTDTYTGNSLICEFLGYPNRARYLYSIPPNVYHDQPYGDSKLHVFDMNFCNDYNWLSVALDRLESMGYTITMSSKASSIIGNDISVVVSIGEGNNRFDCLYRCVVKVIRLINTEGS